MCQNKRLHVEELIEEVDFYWKEIEGIRIRIFTEDYLRMIRPKCCENGCLNCPWKFEKTKKPLD